MSGGADDGGAGELAPLFPALPATGHPVIERLEDFFSSPDFTGAIGDFLGPRTPACEPGYRIGPAYASSNQALRSPA